MDSLSINLACYVKFNNLSLVRLFFAHLILTKTHELKEKIDLTETRKTRANNCCLDLVLQLYRNQLNILEQVLKQNFTNEIKFLPSAFKSHQKRNRGYSKNIKKNELRTNDV